MDFGFWEETRIIWQEQGLPKDANTDVFFGMDRQWAGAPVHAHLQPAFEHKVIEDLGDTVIVRDGDGVTKEQGKFLGSIPRHFDHTLKDRESWEKEFKWRLDGKSPERTPKDFDRYVAEFSRPDRDYPLAIGAGSLYGWIRNWMGVEAVSLIVYDDPELFEEMVDTVTTCIVDAMTPWLETGIQFDWASMWEDMAYRAGPLLSPKVFKRVLVPNYKRITSLLKKYGVDVVVVDCDGDMSRLAPLWLEGGVNTMFPIEVGTWGADPVAYRQQYGKEMLIIGGVSKRLLAGSREEITAEVERLAPLVEDGGFIPTPDHRVPPDVPLDNYIFFLHQARRVWGKGLPNLKPMGELTEKVPQELATRFAWHLGD